MRISDWSSDVCSSDLGKTVAHSVIAAIRKKNELTIPFGDTPVDPAAAKLVLDALGHCFQLMQLRLDEEDDPQIIFETLNASGAPLTPRDLIRNFVFLRAARSQEDVDALFDQTWLSRKGVGRGEGSVGRWES